MTDTVKIYRFENTEDGQGPYSSGFDVSFRLGRAHVADPLRPSPWDDFNRGPYVWEKFGCPSVAVLLDWFAGYVNELQEVGFRIAVYTVPSAHVCESVSGRQFMFEADMSLASEVISS